MDVAPAQAVGVRIIVEPYGEAPTSTLGVNGVPYESSEATLLGTEIFEGFEYQYYEVLLGIVESDSAGSFTGAIVYPNAPQGIMVVDAVYLASASTTPVPEPGHIALLFGGAALFFAVRRRRKSNL